MPALLRSTLKSRLRTHGLDEVLQVFVNEEVSVGWTRV